MLHVRYGMLKNLEFWKLYYYYPLITKCNNQCANVQYKDFLFKLNTNLLYI